MASRAATVEGRAASAPSPTLRRRPRCRTSGRKASSAATARRLRSSACRRRRSARRPPSGSRRGAHRARVVQSGPLSSRRGSSQVRLVPRGESAEASAQVAEPEEWPEPERCGEKPSIDASFGRRPAPTSDLPRGTSPSPHGRTLRCRRRSGGSGEAKFTGRFRWRVWPRPPPVAGVAA
jgi:hypothetical protein